MFHAIVEHAWNTPESLKPLTFVYFWSYSKSSSVLDLETLNPDVEGDLIGGSGMTPMLTTLGHSIKE